MLSRIRFVGQCLGRGVGQVAALKDQLELVWLIFISVAAIAGVGAIILAASASILVAPMALVVLSFAVFAEGAFVQWSEANEAAQIRIIGESLLVVDSHEDNRGGIIFQRLRIKNPNDTPIPGCYGKVVQCNAEGGAQEYRGPPIGYHFPWSTYGSGGIYAKLAAGSEDFLDIAFARADSDNLFIPYVNELTKKIEPHHSMLKGTHGIVIELGSNEASIPLAKYAFELRFGGGTELFIGNLNRLKD